MKNHYMVVLPPNRYLNIYLFIYLGHKFISFFLEDIQRLSGTLTCIVNLRDKYEGKSYCIIR